MKDRLAWTLANCKINGGAIYDDNNANNSDLNADPYQTAYNHDNNVSEYYTNAQHANEN